MRQEAIVLFIVFILLSTTAAVMFDQSVGTASASTTGVTSDGLKYSVVGSSVQITGYTGSPVNVRDTERDQRSAGH